jgi:hypothetical protein
MITGMDGWHSNEHLKNPCIEFANRECQEKGPTRQTESKINSKIKVPFHMRIKIAQIDTSSIEFYSLLLTSLFLRLPVITKSPRGRNIKSYFQVIVQSLHTTWISIGLKAEMMFGGVVVAI